MAEYIDKEIALSLVQPDAPEDEKSTVTIATAKKLVRSIIYRTPTADVASVRHGRWELEYGTYGKMLCSVCKKEALIEKTMDDVGVITNYVDSNYCPNCGAKMDEPAEESKP